MSSFCYDQFKNQPWKRWREEGGEGRGRKESSRCLSRPWATSLCPGSTLPDPHPPLLVQLETKQSASWKSSKLAGPGARFPRSPGPACFRPTVWAGLSFVGRLMEQSTEPCDMFQLLCQERCSAGTDTPWPRQAEAVVPVVRPDNQRSVSGCQNTFLKILS